MCTCSSIHRVGHGIMASSTLFMTVYTCMYMHVYYTCTIIHVHVSCM